MSNTDISIQILGGGDAFGSGGNFQTSFYISNKNFHFLVDCGATALISMKRHFIAPEWIDTILLTHLHGDHFSGISFFLLDAQYVQQRKHPLHIIGPKGTEEKVFKALEIFYPGVEIEKFSYFIKFKEYDSFETFNTGPLTIETFPVIHAQGARPHGFRITFDKKILAFSGDTTWDDILYKIAEKADVFMCECNFYETTNDNHLNYKLLQEKIKNLTCNQIILNHLGDEMLQNIEKVNLPIAEDGKIFEV